MDDCRPVPGQILWKKGARELCEVFDEEPGMEEKENKGQGTKHIDLKYNKKQYRLSAYLCF